MDFNFFNKKEFFKSLLVLGVVAILALIIINKTNKGDPVSDKGKTNDFLSLIEIKSICLSASATLKEGVLDYKEKSSSPSDEFWQWNPKVVVDATKIFENEKGPLVMLDVTTFSSKDEAISNYDKNVESMKSKYESTGTPKELTMRDLSISDQSSITSWSEGYGTESSFPKNKSNTVIFIKGDRRVLLSDTLGNIIPEMPLNCTQEQLIKLGELVAGKI